MVKTKNNFSLNALLALNRGKELAANTVLDKALKFDENDFMRKELAKVRELLEDSEAGKSTQIIDISE